MMAITTNSSIKVKATRSFFCRKQEDWFILSMEKSESNQTSLSDSSFIAEVVAAMAVAVTVPDINMECVFSWFLAWSDAASGMKRSEGGGLKCHAATDRD